MDILYWNRKLQKQETEHVYGDRWLKLAYGTDTGLKFVDHLLVHHSVSQFYGSFQSVGLSRLKIPGFIEKFKIPMEEYEKTSYRNFNEFFIRKFKSGQRSFELSNRQLSAFAEARYLGFEKVSEDLLYPVKSQFLRARDFLGHTREAQPFLNTFEEGPLLIARLCPVDYHRFHFPDSGEVLAAWRVPGVLHSVNPIAIQKKPDLFIRNERFVTILQTEHFGKLAFIEVGALCVGKIVQTHPAVLGDRVKENSESSNACDSRQFKRGDEKGYFLFGGSSVVLLGEKNRWKPSQDILENTAQKREVLIRLGEEVGISF